MKVEFQVAPVETQRDKAEVVVQLIEVCNAAVMKIVFVVILVTPVGVASLIAKTILNACSIHLLLKSLGLYIVTVLSGLLIHSFVILPLTVFILSRQNPVRVFRSFLPALIMGFSTSSGAATMPVTMQCGEDYGCERSIVQFVVPLGTNINRDGTALYEAVAVIFVCHAVSLPQYISDISILFAVDWILGMVRTSVNIWGDACACVIVDKWEKRRSKTNSLPKYVEGNLSSSHQDDGVQKAQCSQ
ncbi:hypothetical protein L7F22_015524 [Adiantum nelumboides]|nr:hypothetical protein [Adiantum nelumboides]